MAMQVKVLDAQEDNETISTQTGAPVITAG